VPDDDKLPRSLSGRWRRVLKALQAGEPQDDIAYHVARATAESLRRMHGVPELPNLGVRLYQVVTGGADCPDAKPGSPASPSHVPTKLARRAVDVLSIVMKDRLALISPDSASQALARRVVADVAHAFGLDRMAPLLLASGYDNGELRRQYENLAHSNPLGELARRLLAHPDGTGLRAPGRPRPKLATSDLMDVDVAEML
jgi:hypothetical protein